MAENVIITLGGVLAYSLALKLNLEIAAEYRNVRWLRLAWLMLAVNAGLSIFRPLVTRALNPFAQELQLVPLQGLLNHLLIVPANTALLIGVLAMWWAYHEAGLGIRIKARDYALMAGFLGLMLTILALREGLTEARSTYPFASYLQLIGLGVISIATALSIVLHRLAQQVGGSQLAVSLRWLVAYLWLRNLLVLAATLPLFLKPEDVVARRLLGHFTSFLWPVVPWLVALAAAYRAELTTSAARELQQRRAAKVAPARQSLPEREVEV
ncbi:MAG: hypothetical protein ACREEM_05095 [Blastocatellia bacterium]